MTILNAGTCCRGQCHCGDIQIEVELPQEIVVYHCNCSICTMTGFVHLIVKAEQLTVLCGRRSLREYRFNSGTARHLFCPRCGVKAFYVPRSHPDGFSVNLNCLDLPAGSSVTKEFLDGRDWERNAGQLPPL